MRGPAFFAILVIKLSKQADNEESKGNTAAANELRAKAEDARLEGRRRLRISDNTIWSSDDDAIERLTERIAKTNSKQDKERLLRIKIERGLGVDV